MMLVRDGFADHRVDKRLMRPTCYTFTGVIQP